MGMALEYLYQRPIVSFRIGGTRRIGRRIEQQPARSGRDCCLQLFRLQLESCIGSARNELRHAATDLNDIGVGGPVGRRDDDFVTLVQSRHEGVEQDLLGTGCNGNLVQRVVYAVLDRELLSNSLLQLKGAVEWGVLGVASINSGFGGR